jgi:hypothetical protein
MASPAGLLAADGRGASSRAANARATKHAFTIYGPLLLVAFG